MNKFYSIFFNNNGAESRLERYSIYFGSFVLVVPHLFYIFVKLFL